ncbi:MAG: spermidine/putrescine ABC transporter substrate-binding protein, partial [Cellulomonadaceae bacterium]|nr:spermidine/putrescine ABC transporter substrate-binding protein [Cellulomonadaceae bacterium]
MPRQLPLPADPTIRALVQAQRGVSRRSVLAGGAGLAGVSALLAACGTGGTSSGPSATGPVADLSETEKLVRWANWTLYLDYDEDTQAYPTLVEFTAQTGIEVDYAEDIEDNDS